MDTLRTPRRSGRQLAVRFFATERSVRIAQIYLGICIIPIGISHFVYHEATILLIPQWLPDRSFFAYLTGAGQIASGLGLIFNVLPRVAALPRPRNSGSTRC